VTITSLRWFSYGDENRIGVAHRIRDLRCAAQTFGRCVLREQKIQSRLINGNLAGFEPRNPLLGFVNANDCVSEVRKTDRGYKRDIACINYCDFQII